MANEIKMDRVDMKTTPMPSPVFKREAGKQEFIGGTEDGIKVNIQSFEAMAVAENTIDDASRVNEMKSRVAAGNYKVDTDALAQKLYDEVFKSVKTIG